MEAGYRNKFQCIMRRAFSTPTKRKLTLCAVRQLQLSALQDDYPCNSFSAGDILRARRSALFLRFSRRSAELTRPEHLIRRSLRRQKFVISVALQNKGIPLLAAYRWKIQRQSSPINGQRTPPIYFSFLHEIPEKACSLRRSTNRFVSLNADHS